MHRLSVNLLGYFKIELDGKVITQSFRTEKEKALFAYLVMETSRPVNRDSLAELLWPDRTTSKSRTNLRQALYGVRKVLKDQDSESPYLLVLDDSVQFNRSTEYHLDIEEFTDLLQSIQTHDHEELETCDTCLKNLQYAIDLYRGPFFEDLYQVDSLDFMEWLYSHRERYFRFMLSALHNISGILEKRGEFEAAIKYSKKQVDLDAMDESSQRQLMQLLFKSGRRSAALEQFKACKKILVEELGVEPSCETIALYNRIKEGTIPIQRHPQFKDCNVPSDLTSFIGRETILERLTRCVQNPVCRLLSFVGLPGIGKTRLATQTAHRFKDIFTDGVSFFALDEKTSDLQTLLTESLCIRGKPLNGARDQLLETLISKKMLLIFDNFDQNQYDLDLLIEILHNSPGIKIIVTSQERLNYQAACLFEIRGLRYPGNSNQNEADQFPAIQLFQARAFHSRSDFKLTERNIPHIKRICEIVEGNPLAIELAAANVSHFTVEQIADSLEDSICILTTHQKDIPHRHRKMRNAIETFWNKLPAADKKNAVILSAYDGDFQLEDAQIISGLSAEDLSCLVEKSVLDRNNQGLFHMHNLLRIHIKENGLGTLEIYDGVEGQEGSTAPQTKLVEEFKGISESGIFWDRLKHLLHRSQRNKSKFGIVALDIFGGTDYADVASEDKATAVALTSDFLKVSLRKADTIARLRPTEFTLLVEDLKDKEDLRRVIDKISIALSEPVDTGDYTFSFPFRIGSSFYPEDGDDAFNLVRHARENRNGLPSDKLDFYLYTGKS